MHIKINIIKWQAPPFALKFLCFITSYSRVLSSVFSVVILGDWVRAVELEIHRTEGKRFRNEERKRAEVSEESVLGACLFLKIEPMASSENPSECGSFWAHATIRKCADLLVRDWLSRDPSPSSAEPCPHSCCFLPEREIDFTLWVGWIVFPRTDVHSESQHVTCLGNIVFAHVIKLK